MADKIRVWFDAEADFLEVRFSDAAGYDKETSHDAVMERVASGFFARNSFTWSRARVKLSGWT